MPAPRRASRVSYVSLITSSSDDDGDRQQEQHVGTRSRRASKASSKPPVKKRRIKDDDSESDGFVPSSALSESESQDEHDEDVDDDDDDDAAYRDGRTRRAASERQLHAPETPANGDSTASGYFAGKEPFVDLTNAATAKGKGKGKVKDASVSTPASAKLAGFRSLFSTPMSSNAGSSRKRQATLSDMFGAKSKPTPTPTKAAPKAGSRLKREADDGDDDAELLDLDDFSDDSDDMPSVRKKPKKSKAAKPASKVILSQSSSKGWKSSFAHKRRFIRMGFVPTPEAVRHNLAKASSTLSDGKFPPIHDLHDIFSDMVSRAPGVLELARALQNRPLRVATMCSGTESPLLALELMTRAIKEQHGIQIKVEHVFSCEIEPFKQAYIERNFSPPILFRDVTELGGDRAHTAYGALVDVPGNVDILIAGTSCVDYSHLNNKKKGLNDGGESGRTFHGMLDWVKRHRPALVVLENVKNAPWVGVAETIVAEAGYDVSFSNTFDTKNYYIPHTRQRGYLLATRNTTDCLPENWDLLVSWLVRPASSPFDAFLLPSDDPRIQKVRQQFAHGEGLSKGRSTIDWSKCQSRHERARDEEELGKTRPLTAWEEGGTCKMSHDGWNEWAVRQPERVTDLLDITTLRFAALDQDPMYKSKIWELSQNVDRNVAASRPGIAPCLTPSGIPFIPIRGAPMIGLEALSLQGLPLDELLLTRETDDQLQDLAGNAMSSTVVGACVLSALLVARGDFEREQIEGGRPSLPWGSSCNERDAVVRSSDVVVDLVAEGGDAIAGVDSLESRTLDLTSSERVAMPSLLKDAVDSSQLCICEGRTLTTDRPIYRCTSCDHTACESCKGRPVHDFELDARPRTQPDEFGERLKRALPMRLQADAFALDDITTLARQRPSVEMVFALLWSQRVSEVLGGAEFRFQELLRQKVWQARFVAPGARLDLILDPIAPHWRIFVDARPEEPAGSHLRAALMQPVARMALDPLATDVDLFHGSWEICVPTGNTVSITLTSSGDHVPTWQSALGLGGKFADTKRFAEIHVKVPEEAKAQLDCDIEGVYDLMPQCGTANASLHARRGDRDGAGDGRKLYLFIDADRYKDASGDRFVFSTDIGRLPYPLQRPAVGRLPEGWKPKLPKVHQRDAVEQVKLQIDGTWITAPALKVKPGVSLDGQINIATTPVELDLRQKGCERALAVLECSAPVPRAEHNRIWPINGAWGQVDLLHKTNTTFGHLAWLVERVPDVSAFDDWMPAKHGALSLATAACKRCAPAEPDIQWLAMPGRPVVPIENTQQAGPYEQALKNRPAPFVMHLRLSDGLAQTRFGINAATLMHRALSRLPSNPHAGLVELSWRLTKLDKSLNMFSLPRYTIKSNRQDAESPSPDIFALELRKEQKRSLTWMLAQERKDVEPFHEEEISEGLLAPFGWRAEGRATRPVTVRGGVLADAVGYGKTAISLALIAASPDRDRLPELPEGDEDALIPTKATLVIVPGHLCKQWQREVAKFCGNSLSVRVVTSKNELNKLTVRDVLKADIIIMSVTVYRSDTYWETLARVSAANPLPNRPGRFFNAALKRSLAALRNRVKELTSEDGVRQLAQSIKKRVDFDNSHMTSHRARGRLIGQAYADAHGGGAKVKNEEKGADKGLHKDLQPKSKAEPDPWNLASPVVRRDWKEMTCPPLEMFLWNRVVVDEFHYIAEAADRTLAGVTSLQARAKWILSGTPPTADFSDVKSIAVFLNLHLGVDDDADTIKDSVRRAREKNRTAAEKFNNFREMHSAAWHHRRQQVAQRFLDAFVRSNEPEIGELPSEQLIKPIRLPAAESALYLELAHAIENLDLRHQRKVFKGKGKARGTSTLAATKKIAADAFVIDDDEEDASDSDGGGKAKAKKGTGKAAATTTAAANKVGGKKGDPDLEMSHRDRRLIETLGNSASPEEALLKRASVYDDFAGVDLSQIKGVNNAIKACEYIVRERRKQLEDCKRQLERELPLTLEQHLLVLYHFGFRDDNRQFFRDFVRNANNASWGDSESKDMVRQILEEADCTMDGITREAARRRFGGANKGALQVALKRREKERAAAAKGGAAKDGGAAPKKKLDPKDLAWEEEYLLRAMVHQLTRLRNELVGRVNALRFFTAVRDCQRAHLDGVEVDIVCPSAACKHGGERLKLDDVSISSTCGHAGCRDCVLREAYIGQCPTADCAALAKPTSVVNASSLGVEDDGAATRYGTKLALLCSLLKRLPDEERALVFVQFETLTATVAEALQAYGISFVQLTGSASRRSSLLEAYQDDCGARVLLLNVDDESAAGSNLTVANHVIFVGPLLKQEQQQYDGTMTQAIGRCVRYGQTKKVFVWRFIAMETIDQDTIEKRERITLDVDELEARFDEAAGGALVLEDVKGTKGTKAGKGVGGGGGGKSGGSGSGKRGRAAASESDSSDEEVGRRGVAARRSVNKRRRAAAEPIVLDDDDEEEDDDDDDEEDDDDE
ncbi:uncharacterized protein PSFLO_04539 [Pseudozyma flocculosa]|uniref:Helicase ATP-binding domain-containing protein n=1 Tax=Pseudozyma flocculosa TaxID=84751 RepID=A0A5C3F4K9_9BASI|nr:uncharacterized protein PSFLO_04539 [Pseudozyma flocculosa]